jgi:hypothetical protein
LLLGLSIACYFSSSALAEGETPGVEPAQSLEKKGIWQAGGLEQKGTWQIPTGEKAHAQASAWLAVQKPDAATLPAADKLWLDLPQPPSGADLLDRLARTIALVDAPARELVELCSKPRTAVSLPSFPWLTDEKTPAIVRNNLRLLYGRWLAQEQLYDESHAQVADLKAEDVVDPASLLFYQSVAHHRLLEKEPGLAAIGRLLEKKSELPRRYESVARLMQADLSALEDESLDHIARRMDDIRRRLDLGRAGPKVREVEDGVIKSLDKMIEKIEQQQAAAAAAAASASGSIRSSTPAQDSMPMGGLAAGQVTKKNIGNKSGWGDLPPKQRQEALQQIGKDYPAHYRDVIEQYFRKLASEDSER